MPIINGKKVDELNFEYGAYVDYNESVPTLKYGTKPGTIVVRKGDLSSTVGYDGFDNNLGGIWNYYIDIPISTSPTEQIQYKIVIDGDSINVYSNDGTSIIATGNGGLSFWGYVQGDGSDIRIFDTSSYAQNYFWIESFDYANKKVELWVKLETGQSGIGIACGNNDCTTSSYNDGDLVFEFFDDFNGDSLDTTKWTIVSGTPTVSNSQLHLTRGIIQTANFNMIPSFIFECEYIQPTDYSYATPFIYYGLDRSNYNILVKNSGDYDYIQLFQVVNGTVYNRAITNTTVNVNQWYNIKTVVRDNGSVTHYFDTASVNTTYDYTIFGYNYPLFLDMWASDFLCNYIRVRKYIPTDLTFETPTIKQF
jgi:hypothetical protein